MNVKFILYYFPTTCKYSLWASSIIKADQHIYSRPVSRNIIEVL